MTEAKKKKKIQSVQTYYKSYLIYFASTTIPLLLQSVWEPCIAGSSTVV